MNILKQVGIIILSLVLTTNIRAQNSQKVMDQQPNNYRLRTTNFIVEINEKGNIQTISDYKKNQEIAFSESTEIEGLYVDSHTVQKLTEKSLQVVMTMYDSLGDRSCTILKTIESIENRLKFNVKVKGKDYNWTAPILTNFNVSGEQNPRIWSAWANNSNESTYNLDGDKHHNSHKHFQENWQDPLKPQGFLDMELWYGSKKSLGFTKGFSLPLASVILPDKSRSINIVLSPEDTIINLNLKTKKEGFISFGRQNHRIGIDNTISFTYDLFIDEPDWRPVLGWITKQYPAYFNPPLQTTTNAIAGCASYSGYDGELDTKKLQQINYGFNWYASRSWPYLGMFLPPVKKDETWESWSGFGSGTLTKGKVTSFESINNDYKKMHERGFKMLAYFNLNEFGYRICFPLQKTDSIVNKQDLWKDSNMLIRNKFEQSILYTHDNRVRFSWNKSVVMDPGQTDYKNHLINQVKMHIEKIPDFDGICIDRLDWFDGFNFRRDDAVSYLNGKEVWAMSLSLHNIMGEISPLLHQHNKVIYYNPHITRLDFAQYFDGIFDEFADKNGKLNLSAFLALKKPITGWIHSEEILREASDQLIQKYLYLGVYPMAPFPEANHSLLQSTWSDSLFLDYGLMFHALDGKEWIFEPNIVSILKGNAKINIFKTSKGIIVPVMLGNGGEEVTINVGSSNSFKEKGNGQWYIAYPGDTEWKKLKIKTKHKPEQLSIKLKRGCALLAFY